VNTITGEGLNEVMRDARVVIDFANSASFGGGRIAELVPLGEARRGGKNNRRYCLTPSWPGSSGP
jgi:hypothetical protein